MTPDSFFLVVLLLLNSLFHFDFKSVSEGLSVIEMNNVLFESFMRQNFSIVEMDNAVFSRKNQAIIRCTL